MPARILVFHGIHELDLPLETFREQMRFIKDTFEVRSLQYAAENATDAIVLTFDDGLKNFMQAYPILQELQLPATLFVCPKLVSEQKWIWNHNCRARLATLAIRDRVDFVDSLGLMSLDTELIIWYMKNCGAHRRDQIISSLISRTGNFYPAFRESERYDMLTWADIKSLDDKLITIGSHSTSHQPLTTISKTSLRFEVEASKFWLESELSRDVDQFCYPEGMYNNFVVDCVTSSGYGLAVTLNNKPFERGGDFPLTIPRTRLPWTKEKNANLGR